MLGTTPREDCVNGASRLGGGGLDGGARFMAGPDGTSGTAAGGTGGGGSGNIWASAGTICTASAALRITAASRRPPRRNLMMPPARYIIGMLFTENAAN